MSKYIKHENREKWNTDKQNDGIFYEILKRNTHSHISKTCKQYLKKRVKISNRLIRLKTQIAMDNFCLTCQQIEIALYLRWYNFLRWQRKENSIYFMHDWCEFLDKFFRNRRNVNEWKIFSFFLSFSMSTIARIKIIEIFQFFILSLDAQHASTPLHIQTNLFLFCFSFLFFLFFVVVLFSIACTFHLLRPSFSQKITKRKKYK